MTPALRALDAAGIAHRVLSYAHDPRAPAYGLEAAEALDLAPETVFKTLLARLDDDRLVVALVAVVDQLDLKALARACGAKRAQMASPEEAQRATGYVVGGISPLGQKRRLPTLIDQRAEALSMLHISAGKRGLEVALAPGDLARLCQARFAALARP